MFGGSYTAGPEHVMKPDMTWENTSHLVKDSTSPAIGSEFFTSKGIFPHGCTSIKEQPLLNQETVDMHLCNGSLGLYFHKSDTYTIRIYTAKGEVVSTVANRRFTEGKHRLSLESLSLSPGVYVVGISNDISSGFQKIRIK